MASRMRRMLLAKGPAPPIRAGTVPRTPAPARRIQPANPIGSHAPCETAPARTARGGTPDGLPSVPGRAAGLQPVTSRDATLTQGPVPLKACARPRGAREVQVKDVQKSRRALARGAWRIIESFALDRPTARCGRARNSRRDVH